MGIYNKYPYTDFHELNLDWILKTVKTLSETVNDFDGDIQGYVIQKLTEWLNDGTLESIIAESIDDALFYVTPQQYGAVGDGITDDTAAFTLLAASSKAIIIPAGSYKITSKMNLNNVLLDDGIYTIYKPNYKHNVTFIQPDKLTLMNSMTLPAYSSSHGTIYAETCVYWNDRYYVPCYAVYTGNRQTYVEVYDADGTFLFEKRLPVEYNTANSCFIYNDRLYIDFDGGYHVSFDHNVENPIIINNPNIRSYGVWNNTIYGIAIGDNVNNSSNTNDITIYEVEADLTTVINAHVIHSSSVEMLQSTCIYNGLCLIPTACDSRKGNHVRIIDLFDYSLTEILFQSNYEIEAFFEKDGELLTVGGHYGINGYVDISGFLGGVDYPYIQSMKIDGDVQLFMNFGIYDYDSYTSGIYKVSNGSSIGLPCDDCTMTIFNDVITLYDTTNNAIYRYNNGWKYAGAITRASINIGSNISIYRPAGTDALEIRFGSCHFTQQTTHIDYDLSDLWTMLGTPDSEVFSGVVFAGEYASLSQQTYGYYLEYKIAKTGITIDIGCIGGATHYNAYLKGTFLFNTQL